MTTEPLEQAIASTRAVLTTVSKDQLDDPTPCAEWKISDLIDHVVGGLYFFEASAKGDPPTPGQTNFADTDFVAAFDEGSQRALAAFRAPGAMDKMLTLPFGQMPGSAFVGVAATDTFTHGWDLARATGQSTNLAPDLAERLLGGAKQFIQPAFRSPDLGLFGPEQSAPPGASSADQLAAFLGRAM